MPEQRTEQLAVCAVCGGVGRFAYVKRGFEIYRCSGCATLFVSPIPTEEQLARIYSENYFVGAGEGYGYANYDEDKRPSIRVFHKYLDMIDRHRRPPGMMLDIGAATGFFLQIAVQRGWSAVGVELSDYAASAARSKGLDVRTGSMAQLAADPESMDVITMWDVIEHVPDPRKALADARKLLKPGGILALNTPDSGSLFARTLGGRWHLIIPPEHLCLLNRHSIARLLEASGFEVLRRTNIGKWFSVAYVLQTLGHWSKTWDRVAGAVRGSWFGRLSVPINFRDNMLVLARKGSD